MLGKMRSAVAVAFLVGAASASFPAMEIGKDVSGKSVEMPMVGVGTWPYSTSGAEAEVTKALTLGVRLIDTNQFYGNQRGIAAAIKKSGVKRDELFISAKVPGGLSTEATIRAHEENLRQLEVASVDLLLTDSPCNSQMMWQCSKEDRITTWKGLEALYRNGKARAIGVSRYCQRHLEEILDISEIPISVNQHEWHVGMGPIPEGVASLCKKHNISFQSFSPFSSPFHPSAEAEVELRTGDLVTSIGKAHNVTGAQVSLRWLVQQGSPVIPAQVGAGEDLGVFDWYLTASEMEQLDAATSPPHVDPLIGFCRPRV